MNWIEIENKENTPDTTLWRLDQSSGKNVLWSRPVEVVDWEENVKDIMEVIKKKCRRRYPANYLLLVNALTDTDSMFFVASEKGGLYPCPGGQHKLDDATPAIKAITWKQVNALCAKLNSLNPYDPSIVSDILKVEDSNYARNGKQHQLFGLAVSVPQMPR